MRLKAFIVPPGDDLIAQMWRNRGHTIVETPEESDIMVWTGGEDINPALYGEKPIPGIWFNRARDEGEIEYWIAYPEKFHIGICRGGQFLNVMNDGKLWQDVDNHTRYHNLIDIKTDREIFVSSTHHQQFRMAKGAEIVAIARETKRKRADDGYIAFGWRDDSDLEVLWYPKTRTLCFQPHPEYNDAQETGVYFFELLKRYYK